jgi:tetratricopeptide (TPR) repeat protein
MRSVLAGLAALSLGCATMRPDPGRATVTVDELLAGAPLVATPDTAPPVAEDEVLLVSPEMQAFLDRHVARRAGSVSRLRQLVGAILDEKSLGLEYDESTRTAAETFRARRGNCLSFSSMFLAMARRAGLRAYYQEVDTPPDWTLRNEVLVLNRHVNVLVDTGRGGDHEVDFNLDGVQTRDHRRRISDARALSHYDNNVAIERMQAGDAAAAFRYLRRAVRREPAFAPAWTNMGILYRRQGHLAHAEAAYLQALAADGRDLVAMSNLTRLYEQLGDHERAAGYRRRVTRHRDRNPYYRFQLAREAVLARDYDAAISHLHYAVDHRRDEDRFYFLLGVSYAGKGDVAAARKWFARAERIAGTDALKRSYASKAGSLLKRSRVPPAPAPRPPDAP